MPKYSDKAIFLMKSIVEASKRGKTFKLKDKRAAVNMRQRIYNYRNRMLKDKNLPVREKRAIEKISIIVKDNYVLVAAKEPDYLDSIESQLSE